MSSIAHRLPLRLKAGHGLGAVAMGIKETGLTTFFMLYYNQVLGFDPRLISLILIIAMFVDAIVDPSIGRLSDRTKSRWGRRLPWLYWAALPMAASWTALWLTREPSTVSAILLLMNVIAVRLMVSACEIPSVALVAELTSDYDERTGLTRFRFLFGWLGGLAATAMAYGVFLVSPDGQSNGLFYAEGYWKFGLFGAALILISTLGSALAQHRTIVALPPPPPHDDHHSMWQDLRKAFRNKSFRALSIGAIFILGSQATTVAGINYMMLYVWQLTNQQIALYPIGLAVSVLAAFLLIAPLHRRFGKRETAIWGALSSAALTFIIYGARNLGYWPELGSNFAAVFLLICITTALLLQILCHISASSMVAEIVEDHEVSHGERREGLFYSGYLMIQKFGQAFGIFIVGQMVALSGLEQKVRPEDLPPQIGDNLGWAYAGLVVAMAIGATIAFRAYSIDRAGHEARLATLAANRTWADSAAE